MTGFVNKILKLISKDVVQKDPASVSLRRGDLYKSVANGIMEWWKNGMMATKAEFGLILF